ncbi:37S ribosomal protein S8, mitochondrial [[Candida] railenensis]|uniref:37S ribosomal protein S8, mitochondrial n=1 Tax=[Candida] railenensis TaxID=45579 RepID=A0A9P0QLH1_9ASCO|nr:37S ribosomal protein S8, mitochondrial [[Candida] railenensis]
MSLVNLAHFASHVKNCTRVNISATSVPFSRLHLQVALQLYKEGFISSVQKGSTSGPDIKPVDITPDNVSTRRLWLGLKYRNNQPVLRDFSLISKPGRRVNLTNTEVKALASGLTVRFIRPLQPAECMFIKTDEDEVVEIQEAAKRHLSGLVLCRVK